jgi:acetyltransferase-like isoleucine patch superfamily enzyme
VFRRFIRYLALTHNKAIYLHIRFNRPDGKEWAEYLRRHLGLYHLGADCSIQPSTRILDPSYTWLGNRVCLGTCTLMCRDTSAEILEPRGVRGERIAPVIIHDDVFVGHGAIVLGGTTIGEGSIIGAGSVMRESVPAGSIVMGNPAKVVAKVEDLIRFWQAESMQVPWADLIARREGTYDAAMEPELRRMRQQYFFGELNQANG